MFISPDEVPLSQTPDGYRLASSLLFPKKLAALDTYLPYSFTLVWIVLASLGLIAGSISQGAFAKIIPLLIVLVVGFICFSVSIIHGVIQRQMSHLLGYDVSYDIFLLFRSDTYFAAPGQFQARRDGLLIVGAPVGLFMLLLLPLFVLPPGIVSSVLAYFIVVNTLGSVRDFYAFCRLCTMPRGTLLYIESLKNIFVLEAIERVKGQQKDSVLIRRRRRPVLPGLQWKENVTQGDTGSKEISPEDEDILAEEHAKYAPSKWNAALVRWLTRLRSNDLFELSTESAADFSFAVGALLSLIDERGNLFDLKFSDTDRLNLVSVRNREDTQLSEEEEQEKVNEVMEKARFCEIKAVIGAGFLQLTPAVVSILLERLAPDQTRIEIKGVAKETWIKQHAAEKAALSVSQWCEEFLK